MTPDAVKWALIDLLRVSDAAHGGRFHAELARIARTLGIEIPPVDPVPDPPGGAFEDNDDRGNALAGLLELLDALWPAAQNPHGFRTDQIAERMIDHGLGLDAQALGLRSLFDALGPCPLNAATPPWHRQPAAPGDQQSCGRRRCRPGPSQAP